VLQQGKEAEVHFYKEKLGSKVARYRHKFNKKN
jgi:hypothetical protein